VAREAAVLLAALLAVASRVAAKTALASAVVAVVRLAAATAATMVVQAVREARWALVREEAQMGVDETAAMATESAMQAASTAGRGAVASKAAPMDLVMAVGQWVVERRVAVLEGWTVAASMAEALMVEAWTAVDPVEALLGAA
tara:strand:- start:1349 stop:1780 length:432 start_codon:yes stop_codon:yes gene_type:complete